jgi:hypothetical protein
VDEAKIKEAGEEPFDTKLLGAGYFSGGVKPQQPAELQKFKRYSFNPFAYQF